MCRKLSLFEVRPGNNAPECRQMIPERMCVRQRGATNEMKSNFILLKTYGKYFELEWFVKYKLRWRRCANPELRASIQVHYFLTLIFSAPPESNT